MKSACQVFALFGLLLVSFLCRAEARAKDCQNAAPRDLAWFTQARFGMFVHCGPVSLKGSEISWSRKGQKKGAPELAQAWGHIPPEEYDSLYKQFNPVKYDAREWVRIAKAAGMNYIVLTAKHHDGFCEFDSKLTDYTIMSSPYKKDIVKELAEACHKGGLKLGLYYSPPDWHHPDFLTENHDRYISYYHGQVRELLSNYGQVDIIWFDGLVMTPKQFDSENLFKMIRTLRPHILINNRAGLPGDFDTPEQHIGTFQNDRPWESCITLGISWAYNPTSDVKSLSECVKLLASCACGDGNLLFNVGPRPDGAIEPAQVARLKEMGQWMLKYGRTIYGTRGGPFTMGLRGGSTHKGNKIWLHLFDWKEEVLPLPAFGRKIVSARLLTGKGKVHLAKTQGGNAVSVAPADRDPNDTIIELKCDVPVEVAPGKAIKVWNRKNLAAGKQATASVPPLGKDEASWGAALALDSNDLTRWASNEGVKQATIEIDLGKPTELGAFKLVERRHRISKFTFDVEEAGQWKPVFSGTYVETPNENNFAPVTARKVRLNIQDVFDAPTIEEIELYAPEAVGGR